MKGMRPPRSKIAVIGELLHVMSVVIPHVCLLVVLVRKVPVYTFI